MEIKYLYFEIKYVNNSNGLIMSTSEIENENVLLIKPHTNSIGMWHFRNVTERKSLQKPSTFSIVEQYWIDLDKFNDTNHELYSTVMELRSILIERVQLMLILNKLIN